MQHHQMGQGSYSGQPAPADQPQHYAHTATSPGNATQPPPLYNQQHPHVQHPGGHGPGMLQQPPGAGYRGQSTSPRPPAPAMNQGTIHQQQGHSMHNSRASPVSGLHPPSGVHQQQGQSNNFRQNPGPVDGSFHRQTAGGPDSGHMQNGLERSMQQMHVGVSQAPMPVGSTAPVRYASPPLAQPGDVGPARSKRAARAYHQDDAVHTTQGHMRHPYENAPPASGPQPQYQQAGRPDYLQTEQPLAQPAYDNQQSYHHQQQQQQQQQQHGSHQQMQPQPIAGIPQPPHNPGTKLPGLRNRIDPDQIPSVVAVQEQDQEVYDNEPYLTCGRGTVPLSTTEYTAIDQGSSTPRFMRFTTYNLPATNDLAELSHLPLGLVVQPFAKPLVAKGEEPIYTVDFSQTAPPRCKRCRGYINPWCQFIEAGQKFVCNLCGQATEVPTEYFSHLDMNGRRLDLDQRPELLKGSIDFIVPKDYWVQDTVQSASSGSQTVPRTPHSLHYVFAIDVSADTSRLRGAPANQPPELHPHPMLREVCRSLKTIIYGAKEEINTASDGETGGSASGPQAGLPRGAKIAILAFDKVVHFFNLKPGLDKPQMLVVGDIDDMFMPLSEGFLVDAVESKTLVVSLLDSLPDLFAKNTVIEAAIGGPLKAASIALKNIGGQLNIFQTRLPTAGPGLLKHRDETKLQGTDKERSLFVPQDPFYRQMAEEAVEAGVGINLFLFPNQFIDVATLGVLAGLTGGDVFFHPRFDPVRDGIKLHSQMQRVLQREIGYCVTMRIRCSEGLRVAEHFGNFYQRNVTDLEFGSMDEDKAVAALIKHEGKLDDKRDAYFQCAILYTSATGERRVRLHNVAVPVTQVMANVFRFADMDATMTYCAKEAIVKTISKSLRDVREGLTDLCTKVLLAYRKHCASTTSPGQLILPESFKLFPVFALAFLKTKALKGGPVVSDVRTHYMRLIKGMGVQDTMELLYPKMLPIHSMSPEAMQPDENGRVRLPRLMRVSYARMEAHGAYLVYNGDIAVLWLGAAVSPQILRDLYGAESLEELNPRMTRLPKLPTRLSEQVRRILATFEEHHSHRKLPLYIARQNIDGIEIEFSNMLVEDANNDNLSYVDYLCFVHKNIQQELSGEKQQTELDAQTMWRTW